MAHGISSDLEQIHDDNEEKFNDLFYVLACDTCGQEIRRTILAIDFLPHSWSGTPYLGRIFNDLVKHNLTHCESSE